MYNGSLVQIPSGQPVYRAHPPLPSSCAGRILDSLHYAIFRPMSSRRP